ncbi:MAG: DUF1287 domain-containing protein [Holophagaceae bacterium]|nr:DUF1287 domain-containing protein [Holophagaceae bacterium]
MHPWIGLVLLLAAVPPQPSSAGSPGSAARMVAAARAQVGVTIRYDSAYRRLAYPGGDVPVEQGVCTDVVIRACRTLGLDLQALVHRDMVAAWDAYPKLWGLRGPDPNIDHRRVPNLAAFLRRHGQVLAVSRDPKAYAPGDLVTWRLISGLPHIGIISDERTPAGLPLVIHNIGAGVKEEDILFVYTVTGHFRFPPDAAP